MAAEHIAHVLRYISSIRSPESGKLVYDDHPALEAIFVVDVCSGEGGLSAVRDGNEIYPDSMSMIVLYMFTKGFFEISSFFLVVSVIYIHGN